MRLNKLQQKIISILETFPIENKNLPPTGIIEPLQIRIGETVTGILRSLRRSQAMVWDPWILKDGDIYRLFYLQGLEGQIPWWTISKICGAISTDMKHWQDLGTIHWHCQRTHWHCRVLPNLIHYEFKTYAP